eukprot:TRINITY_DN603_c0_g1_i1.p1 TRINITY_DN603_c0_g1~~TRINITY_DN603_c0_g1_i1.p1  ORF type:complete len:2599 (-),score=583.24 TRINITY_DN603_c0_g1_i1:6794-14590(-)
MDVKNELEDKTNSGRSNDNQSSSETKNHAWVKTAPVRATANQTSLTSLSRRQKDQFGGDTISPSSGDSSNSESTDTPFSLSPTISPQDPQNQGNNVSPRKGRLVASAYSDPALSSVDSDDSIPENALLSTLPSRLNPLPATSSPTRSISVLGPSSPLVSPGEPAKKSSNLRSSDPTKDLTIEPKPIESVKTTNRSSGYKSDNAERSTSKQSSSESLQTKEDESKQSTEQQQPGTSENPIRKRRLRALQDLLDTVSNTENIRDSIRLSTQFNTNNGIPIEKLLEEASEGPVSKGRFHRPRRRKSDSTIRRSTSLETLSEVSIDEFDDFLSESKLAPVRNVTPTRNSAGNVQGRNTLTSSKEENFITEVGLREDILKAENTISVIPTSSNVVMCRKLTLNGVKKKTSKKEISLNLEENEKVLKTLESIEVMLLNHDGTHGIPSTGRGFISNIRLVFTDALDVDLLGTIDIPWPCVRETDLISTVNRKYVVLNCKDFRIIGLSILGQSEDDNAQTTKLILSLASNSEITVNNPPVPYIYKPKENDTYEYNLLNELRRQGYVDTVQVWTVSTSNNDYSLSREYPPEYIVPVSIDKLKEPNIRKLAQMHSYRFPIYCWSKWNIPPNVVTYSTKYKNSERSLENLHSLMTCGALLRGWRPRAIASTTVFDQPPLYYTEGIELYWFATNMCSTPIFDATDRPLQVFDTGPENIPIGAPYSDCFSIQFLNHTDESIHSAYRNLQDYCFTRIKKGDSVVLEKLLNCQWIKLVSSFLKKSNEIANHLKQKNSVLVQSAGAGYENEMVLTSLTQILCDPYYRTIQGFCFLIDKEWIKPGFAFGKEHRYVVYLLFMYCVWSLRKLSIVSFEFNEKCIEFLIHAPLISRFKNFWFNNELERSQNREFLTQYSCAFSYATSNNSFKSDCYQPNVNSSNVYIDLPANFVVLFWSELFLKWNTGVSISHHQLSVAISARYEEKNPTNSAPTNNTNNTNTDPRKKEQASTSFFKLTNSMNCLDPLKYTLNISDMGVCFLENFEKVNQKLRVLSIARNLLTSLPDCFVRFKSLTKLVLDNNYLNYVGPIIAEMDELTYLSLKSNKLVKITSQISRCKKLTHLYLDDNLLSNDLPNLYLPQLKVLSLSENRLYNLPSSFKDLTNLQQLLLRHNLIRKIPHNMFSLMKNLVELDIAENALLYVPDSVTHLPRLEKLFLQRNQISYLPHDLSRCTSLVYLDANSNLLQNFSLSSNDIFHMEKIDLSFNKISYVSDRLNFIGLQELNLETNSLTSIPSCFTRCNLRSLNIANNQIDKIPSILGKMRDLTSLNLKGNNIRSLPYSLSNMTNLKNLNMDLNLIENIPEHVLNQGFPAIASHLQSYLDGEEIVCRKRVMVVGLENVGKTTLIRSLSRKWYINGDPVVSNTNSAEQLPPPTQMNSISTDGIEVSPYQFPLILNPKSNSLFKLPNLLKDDRRKRPMVNLDVWDFAGQEVYYASHQFFLSHGVIYLIVFKLTQPNFEEDVEFWLSSIKARVKKAKVIICGTYLDECDRNTSIQDKFDAMQIKLGKTYSRSFESLQYFVISSKTQQNIEDLRNALQNLAQQQTGKASLKTHNYFEQVLREARKDMILPVIDQRTLISVGKACGISSDDEVMACCQKLHEYGSIMYFGDDPELVNLSILDPAWLIKLMATLHTTKHRWVSNGILEHKHFDMIWSKSGYPENIHAALLRLLECFDVAITLKDGHRSLKSILEQRLQSAPTSTPVAGPGIDSQQQFGSHIKKNEGLSLIPSLLPDVRPDKSINMLFKDMKYQFNRVYIIDFIPKGLVPKLLTRVLNIMREVKSLWLKGIAGTLSVLSVTESSMPSTNICDMLIKTYSNKPDSQATKLTRSYTSPHPVMATTSTNLQSSTSEAEDLTSLLIEQTTATEIIVKVQGNKREDVVSLFTLVLDMLDTTISKWKVSWETYADIDIVGVKNRLPLKSVMEIVCQGEMHYLHRNVNIPIPDIVPDLVFPFYGGRYIINANLKINDKLGEGGYATVHGGTWQNAPVAIKMLNSASSRNKRTVDSQLIHIFQHEITIHSYLKHPCILTLLGICVEPMCLVMEMMTGGSVEHLLQSSNYLDWPTVISISIDVCRAIQHINSLKIIHRDIKSPNILLNPVPKLSAKSVSYHAKIIDFGSAIVCPTNGQVRGRVVDCPSWLSPEIICGQPYDYKVDIYAFGIVMCELVSQQIPFHDIDMWKDIEEKVLLGDRPKIPKFCPEKFTEVIQSCWSQNPSKRPDLNAVLASLTSMLDESWRREDPYSPSILPTSIKSVPVTPSATIEITSASSTSTTTQQQQQQHHSTQQSQQTSSPSSSSALSPRLNGSQLVSLNNSNPSQKVVRRPLQKSSTLSGSNTTTSPPPVALITAVTNKLGFFRSPRSNNQSSTEALISPDTSNSGTTSPTSTTPPSPPNNTISTTTTNNNSPNLFNSTLSSSSPELGNLPNTTTTNNTTNTNNTNNSTTNTNNTSTNTTTGQGSTSPTIIRPRTTFKASNQSSKPAAYGLLPFQNNSRAKNLIRSKTEITEDTSTRKRTKKSFEREMLSSSSVNATTTASSNGSTNNSNNVNNTTTNTNTNSTSTKDV